MDQEQIVSWNIRQSKLGIRKALLKDKIVIFFTRVLEDLKFNKNFYGRIKELFVLIEPYDSEENPKRIFEKIKGSDFKSLEGLQLDAWEIKSVKFFISLLDANCRIKDRFNAEKDINKILDVLIKKYLPCSSLLIESFILGKLISAVNGIEKIYKLPASTIQLLGAERALFKHLSLEKPCPKYGLLYYSEKVNKNGKLARKIACKLAISLKQDYFRNFKSRILDEALLHEKGGAR
jgi:RNA processing factor Prp31